VRSVKDSLAFAAAITVLAVSASGQPAPDPPELQPVTGNDYAAGPTARVWVPTRHGILAVDLTLPQLEDGERVPAILTHTPYAALGVTSSTQWVRRGYAVATAHVLGTGDSGGCWDYGGKRERESAFDLVEWLGGVALDGSPSPAAAWTNGKVGMIGASYDGTTANAAAAEAPPHLVTIVPEVAISDWYGYAYHDGVRYFMMDPVQRQGLVIDEQGFDTPLSFDFAYAIAPTRNRDNGFEQRLLERACAGVADKIEHTIRGYETDPDFDAFWQERSYLRDAARVGEANIAVLVEGGWRDYNVKHSESSRWFEAIPVDDPDTEADEGVPYKMLVMGQSAHGAADPEFNYPLLLHAWFDHFLYGYDTNITAQPQALSKANDGVVRRDATWPPPGTEDVALHLRADGRLTLEPPAADEGTSAYLDHGLMTESEALRSRGGEWMLWFESEPLDSETRIAGLPALDLWASTLGTSTHFTPVLFDLGEAGTPSSLCAFLPPTELACTISRGFLNARHHDGLEEGADLVPGEPYRAHVRLIDNDWVVPAGHRIGLALMSSNAWWALPDQQRALNTILHDAEHPSALVLPIVGGLAP